MEWDSDPIWDSEDRILRTNKSRGDVKMAGKRPNQIKRVTPGHEDGLKALARASEPGENLSHMVRIDLSGMTYDEGTPENPCDCGCLNMAGGKCGHVTMVETLSLRSLSSKSKSPSALGEESPLSASQRIPESYRVEQLAGQRIAIRFKPLTTRTLTGANMGLLRKSRWAKNGSR
jgi:hypothetical protein